ncbi:hypothetical protein PI124_g17756 [Phytophthora idaei]|nr:hypothetical protein PI124_g17756 [Phytophthora idaei]
MYAKRWVAVQISSLFDPITLAIYVFNIDAGSTVEPNAPHSPFPGVAVADNVSSSLFLSVWAAGPTASSCLVEFFRTASKRYLGVSGYLDVELDRSSLEEVNPNVLIDNGHCREGTTRSVGRLRGAYHRIFPLQQLLQAALVKTSQYMRRRTVGSLD